jgi:transcriptional regulator GlxA family with amidase domain
VEPDRIFTRKGKIWTSGDVTAGIDLSLALVGEDLGEAIARRTGQELVVYHRRPGGQSQFSALIEMDRQDGRFAKLLDWMRSHLGEPLTVDRLADEAARARVISLGPSQLRRSSHPPRPSSGSVSRAARAQVESSNDPIEQIGEAVGFADPHDRSRFTLKS